MQIGPTLRANDILVFALSPISARCLRFRRKQRAQTRKILNDSQLKQTLLLPPELLLAVCNRSGKKIDDDYVAKIKILRNIRRPAVKNNS